jgi:branched-chain amino acid transport system substrate-binding protein
MAHFALTALNAGTAAVMTNASNQYSVDLARCFMDRFQKEGRVVAEVDYLQAANDFRSELNEIQRFYPDVVFVPGYTRDSAFIIRQARNMGIGCIFLGGDGWGNFMYDYAGDAVIGSYFSNNWHIDQPGPGNRAFSKRYAERCNYSPNGLVALTYDTVYLLADAIRRARSAAPEAIRDALADTRDFIGLTGPVVFDANGDPRKQVVILRFGPDGAVFDRILEIEGPTSRID